MPDKPFDIALVQRQILDSHQRKTNLRRTAQIGRKGKRIVYARYWNGDRIVEDSGIKSDPDQYPTGPHSRISEIYTTSRAAPRIGTTKHRPFELARDPESLYSYEYYELASLFRRDFWNICAELGFNVGLIYDWRGPLGSSLSVSSKRKVAFESAKGMRESVILIKVRIGMDLDKTDPRLCDVLKEMEKAYSRIRDGRFARTSILQL